MKQLKDISTIQKGRIAENRIAELITLYGDTSLSCYKPISDDDGIDLIVKQKGSLKTMYIQIKSRFDIKAGAPFTASAPKSSVLDKNSMALVFCYFNKEAGDISEDIWFIPAPIFIKKANDLKIKIPSWGFVAGLKRKETNKWDEYFIKKQDLANKIIEQMKRN